MHVCCQLYNDCGDVYMLTEYNVLLWVCMVFHTFVMLALSCDSYQSSACETIIDTAMPPSILSLAVAGLCVCVCVCAKNSSAPASSQALMSWDGLEHCSHN